MNLRSVFFALSTALAVGLGPASADQPRELDKEFLIKAAALSNAEVEYAKLAESRAADESVKELARRVRQDHEKANTELAKHAQNQKLAVLAGLEKDKRETHTRLSKLKGGEFDRAFARQMVEDHEYAVKLFEAQASGGQDQDLVKFAKDMLPTLRVHLKSAREYVDGNK